jgi:hypothetical protein
MTLSNAARSDAVKSDAAKSDAAKSDAEPAAPRDPGAAPPAPP